MKKRKRKITPSCSNCDYTTKSNVKEPCLSCSDDYDNWINKKKGLTYANIKNQS